MRFYALATDFDGTLAHNGRVQNATLEALEQLAGSGRKLILVTGRELPDLLAAFPRADLFDLVVAENGALLYRPSTKQETLLSEEPPSILVEKLRTLQVEPLSVGRGIIGTHEPHQHAALEAIRACGLEWQVIFNKGAVMLLPAGVNKALGLSVALEQLQLSPHNVAGIGDAENDHAFLDICEFAAAVGNALAAIKQEADLVTRGNHGEGVAEFAQAMVADDLESFQNQLGRHDLDLGARDSEVVRLPAYGATVLMCGSSGSGKSTIVTRILESLAEKKYQFCLIDPEGDYLGADDAVTLGGPNRLPDQHEVLKLLVDQNSNVIADLTGTPIPERPNFFLDLLPQVLQLRARLGRPNWLIFDETHHLLPSDWEPAEDVLPDQLHSTLLITNHPELTSRGVLCQVDILIAVGSEAWESLQSFSEVSGIAPPRCQPVQLIEGEALFWSLRDGQDPVAIVPYLSDMQRLRHRRKFVEGQLAADRCFYFRGREQQLNLPAQNLVDFLVLAEGVDDDTWEFHRQRHDYSRWLRKSIRDQTLAKAVHPVELDPNLSPSESRARVRSLVQDRYEISLPDTLATTQPGPGGA